MNAPGPRSAEGITPLKAVGALWAVTLILMGAWGTYFLKKLEDIELLARNQAALTARIESLENRSLKYVDLGRFEDLRSEMIRANAKLDQILQERRTSRGVD